MTRALSRNFFTPSADFVAPRLLGHYLIRNTPDGACGGLIVETEAYLADDPACHAFGGSTSRNQTMFGEAGLSYVYLIYGMHHCFNTVCQPKGVGEAVLIRAVEVSLGQAHMMAARKTSRVADLTNGPAKLCQAMRIDRDLDGLDICDPGSPVYVGLNPAREQWLQNQGEIKATRRIGITKAAGELLRFVVAGNRFLSRKS